MIIDSHVHFGKSLWGDFSPEYLNNLIGDEVDFAICSNLEGIDSPAFSGELDCNMKMLEVSKGKEFINEEDVVLKLLKYDASAEEVNEVLEYLQKQGFKTNLRKNHVAKRRKSFRNNSITLKKQDPILKQIYAQGQGLVVIKIKKP